MEKIIKNLNTKKATGWDNIPAKVIVAASESLAAPFSRLYNMCLDSASFPSDAKRAEVIPVYKKDNALEKKNYRPVSILPASSKILEKAIEQDLTKNWLPKVYHKALAAFRPGYSCQQLLLSLCDNWRSIRESKKQAGLLLIDLSKAFDSLPHSLLILTLHAYRITTSTLHLLADYVSQRYQSMKVSSTTSKWKLLNKGIPQGSILGPVMFNLFINDIFSTVQNGSLYNYADDNSILVSGTNKEDIIAQIKENANIIINWCAKNQMEANPGKFQVMISEENTPITINITETTQIESENQVKLLGEPFYMLDFAVTKLARKSKGVNKFDNF